MSHLDGPVRPVTEDEIEAFWRDGVVCLRQVIAPAIIETMAGAVERWLKSPECLDYTQFGAGIAQAAGAAVMLDPGTRRGHFYSGIDHWRTMPEFSQLAFHSPLPELSAHLLRASKLNLYEDSILVKEPGALDKTAFHQDISYFHVEGHQICTTWLPLDPVFADSGALQFVKGSHLWKARYRPNFFITDLQMPDTDGETVPDFHKDTRSREIISFETQPGDLTVHHARTIHGASGNSTAALRRRAISVRYCGDDVRYRLRRGVPRKPHHDHVTDDDVLDHPDCPVVWRA